MIAALHHPSLFGEAIRVVALVGGLVIALVLAARAERRTLDRHTRPYPTRLDRTARDIASGRSLTLDQAVEKIRKEAR